MKQYALLLLFGLAAAQAHADDVGAWLGADVQKNITKKFSVDAGIDLRAEENFNYLTRYAVGVGVGYAPLKWLKIGAGYNFLRDYNLSESRTKFDEDGDFKNYKVDDDYWRSKHRATFDVTGSVKAGRFTFSLRERYQYTHFVATTTTRTTYKGLVSAENAQGYTGTLYEVDGQYFTKCSTEEDDKPAKDRHYLRSRLGVEYSIRHSKWTPYASYEFSNNLGSGEHFHLDKQRLTVGAEWKVSKKHRLDFAYVYNHGSDDDGDDNCHVLSIGYKFKF